MHRLFFILAFTLATTGMVQGQNFDYSVSTDSVAWNQLSSQTILNSNNAAWDFSYRIPIGFTFPCLGRSFDSLTIETNGYLVFDGERNYAMTAFSGLGDHLDSVGNHAIIGYELSGTYGNQVLKIQYLNCSPNLYGEEVQSWQLWLRENGNVEVRVGPGTLRTNSITEMTFDEENQIQDTVTTVQLDSAQVYRVGLLNSNMNTPDRGLFISGNPASPESAEVNESNTEIPALNFVPARGYRYTFAPSN